MPVNARTPLPRHLVFPQRKEGVRQLLCVDTQRKGWCRGPAGGELGRPAASRRKAPGRQGQLCYRFWQRPSECRGSWPKDRRPQQMDKREPQSPRAERRPAFLTHVHLEVHPLQRLTHASPDGVGVCILHEVLTETALGGDHGLGEAGLLQLTPAGPVFAPCMPEAMP